ncbi:MAG: hypothetical protein AAGA01_01520 [Cyanobacteria bacterium P01_E01_bin.43]
MGEAKRRKQLDPTFGDPAYSRYGKAVHQHVQVADLPSQMADVEAYEHRARQVVAANKAELLQLAQAARNRLRGQQQGETLCLFTMRTFDGTQSARIKFERISTVKRLWVNLMQGISVPATEVETWLAEMVTQCGPSEFIWAHPDVSTTGITNRLVPIDDSEIAAVCRPRAEQAQVLRSKVNLS